MGISLQKELIETWTLVEVALDEIGLDAPLDKYKDHEHPICSWQGFVAWVSSFKIKKMSSVENGPLRIQDMLRVHSLKTRMIMHLAKAPNRNKRGKESGIRVFANEVEEREMEDCHGESIKLLEVVLDQLRHLDKGRVLEVAAGDGRVARDLLMNRFEAVDCFDQCPMAVKKLEELQKQHEIIERVDQATM